ncbi:MAG: formimidoylglutamate deiminase [Oligoflexales bacterium]
MKTFKIDSLLQKNGWLSPAFVTVDDSGTIVAVASSAKQYDQELPFLAIPGLPNAHSHAFQAAMVGLAEHLPPLQQTDDFWTWRHFMYKLALQLSPEDVHSIARYLYARMLCFGFTSVAEFHYLHLDPQGKPYSNPLEMTEALCDAAHSVGMQMTLIQVYYNQSTFGKPPTVEQRRFIFPNVGAYEAFVHKSESYVRKAFPEFKIGTSVHSLRAAIQEDVVKILASPIIEGPLHLHIAEQMREVDDCLAGWGKKPLTWLLDNVPIGPNHNLVHSTHVTKEEVARLARSGAQAVLCPTTEANLGDGVFPLVEYLALGGQIAVGTDSHVGINAFEELKWLDYVQRLMTRKRNVLCKTAGDDSGALLFDKAWAGGNAALGTPSNDYFEKGKPFTCLLIDPNHPYLVERPRERLLSSMIYGGDPTLMVGTIVKGRRLCENLHHCEESAIRHEFEKTMTRLRDRSLYS